MPKIVATADIHLGRYWSDMDDKAKEERLSDILRNLDEVVDYAIREKADALIIAGDIFHKRGPSELLRRELAARIRRARDSGVHVVLVAGNHDRVIPRLVPKGADARVSKLDAYSVVEENLTIAGKSPKTALIECRDGGRLGVVAVPYFEKRLLEEKLSGRSPSEYMGYVFRTKVRKEVERLRRAGATHIVVVTHGAVDVAKLGNERVIGDVVDYSLRLEDLRDSGADLVIVGHVHRPQEWEDYNVWCPGSIERLDFGEEGDEKSFMVAEAPPEGRFKVSRIPLPCRPMLTVILDDQVYDDAGEIVERLRALYGDLKGHLLRVKVRTPLRKGLVREAILKELSPLYVSVEKVTRKPSFAPKPVERPRISEEHLKACLRRKYPDYDDQLIEEAVRRAFRLIREVEGA